MNSAHFYFVAGADIFLSLIAFTLFALGEKARQK